MKCTAPCAIKGPHNATAHWRVYSPQSAAAWRNPLPGVEVTFSFFEGWVKHLVKASQKRDLPRGITGNPHKVLAHILWVGGDLEHAKTLCLRGKVDYLWDLIKDDPDVDRASRVQPRKNAERRRRVVAATFGPSEVNRECPPDFFKSPGRG